MRNLKLNSHYKQKLPELPDSRFSKLCLNVVSKDAYAVSSSGLYNLTKDERISQQQWEICNSGLILIAFDFITSINSLCITFQEGDILTANTDNGLVDVAGTVTDGIYASQWSPDEELFILVTRTLNVIIMTYNFDLINETYLEEDCLGEKTSIAVGWGNKITQFHGSIGKQAAKEGNSHNVTPAFEWDDKSPRITWRGDGQLFAVSYVSKLSGERKFRVFSRDGILQCLSESIEGLEQTLSWKPSGSLIASSQRLSNMHNIVFFEKNGLQHGHFTLPFDHKAMAVREIIWNCDSTVLLIWLESLTCKTQEMSLQLWMVGNYHWYLKEELKFDESISDLRWDTEDCLKLYVMAEGHWHIFGFIISTDISRGSSDSDLAEVGVIDGNKLLLTPFRQTVIPPPLSAYEVVFSNQIHAVMFAPPNSLCQSSCPFPELNSNDICVFHGTDNLTFLTLAKSKAGICNEIPNTVCDIKMTGIGENGFLMKADICKFFSHCKLDSNISDSKCNQFYNWLWVNPTTIVSSYLKDCERYFIIFNLEHIIDGKITLRKLIKLNEEMISAASLYDGELLCLQLITGKLLKYNFEDDILSPWIENGDPLKFPSPCYRVFLCELEIGVMPLGLSRRNKLYLGDRQLLADCTSIHIHEYCLLATTTSNNLLIVPLQFKALQSLSAHNQDEWIEVGIRSLERGCRLVTSIPGDTRVLLQMPRGNLEMIHPRPLVINVLKNILNEGEKNYFKAVAIMRRHRIDMNLLYDHDPKDFMANTDQFVNSVNNPAWIDLFIANLNSEDVTLHAYCGSYPNRKNKTEINVKNVDTILDCLRNTMGRIDEERFLLPILSTFVKSSKNEIDLALKKLQLMRTSGKEYKVNVEEGLRHLMYVADTNELCDVALGTYDFDLALMVFEKSQKDPKEYLPFLNKLKELEPNYRKYKINVHLKRYVTALKYLTDFENHREEYLDLIKKQYLYTDALEVIPKKSIFYKYVSTAYADYLSEKKFDNEAAIYYALGGNLELALKAYSSAGNWKQALVTASQLNLSKQQMIDLCYSFAEKLKAKNQHQEAAFLYVRFLHSEEDAAECLAISHQWEDAILLATTNMRQDLIDTVIKPKVFEYYEELLEEIHRKDTMFQEYLNRLLKVRVVKKEEYIDFNEGHELDISDTCSNRSTFTSQSYQRNNIKSSVTSISGKSYRSSKNKRKLERKIYSTKEGSAFEDLGLIGVIHELMVNTFSLTNSTSDLARVLLTLQEGAKAKLIQNSLDSLLKCMKMKRFDVWINCIHPSDDPEDPHDNSFFVQRVNGLEPHLRYPPPMEISQWKLFSIKS